MITQSKPMPYCHLPLALVYSSTLIKCHKWYSVSTFYSFRLLVLHTHKSITNKAMPKISPSYLSTVAGHRRPPMWPNTGHSPPPGLGKAQHHCTAVSIAYTPLQHTATVALCLSVHKVDLFVPETNADEFGFSYEEIYNRFSAMAVKQIPSWGDDHQTNVSY